MSKKNNKNYPFSNEVKKFKEDFKQLIDTMSDDDFMDMMSILMIESEDINDDFWNYDESWEDEAEKFYNFISTGNFEEAEKFYELQFKN